MVDHVQKLELWTLEKDCFQSWVRLSHPIMSNLSLKITFDKLHYRKLFYKIRITILLKLV